VYGQTDKKREMAEERLVFPLRKRKKLYLFRRQVFLDYESHKIIDALKTIAPYSGYHTKPLKFSVMFSVGIFGFKSWQVRRRNSTTGYY
jgi:hypothetical protein